MAEQSQRLSHDHHHYGHDPQQAGLHSGEVIEDEGEQGEHHHHKSGLKKVKDKAKKIKNTIKKHGHSHEHDRGPESGRRLEDIYQEGYEDEEEDEDEEMVNDPEVHGAPIYESTVIKSINLPTDTNINVKKLESPQDDNHEQNLREIARPMAHEFGKPPAMAARGPENKDAPNVHEPKTKIGPRIGLEEDLHTTSPAEIPRADHQSKVADPTGYGGKEEEVAPLASQFGNLNVHNMLDKKLEPENRPYTGSHDQFAPQETPTKIQFNPEPKLTNTTEKPVTSTPEKLGPDAHDLSTQNTMAGKICAAATAATSTAISAKNAVASKLGYGGGPQEAEDSSSKQSTPVVYDFAGKASEKLAPVYESVASAGGALMSKVHYGGRDTAANEGVNYGGTVKGYLAEKFKPGDEDKALSQVITDAFIKKNETPADEGKVRQSEEVTARLGSVAEKKREGEDALVAGAESSGQGVMDRLKDAVGTWLGKSTGIETAKESLGGSHVSTASSASGQESKAEQRRG